MTGWLGSSRINTASAGALALTGASSETITLSNYSSYASLSLGASGAATYSGALTPAGAIYRLGGGGGTLTFASALTGSRSLVRHRPGNRRPDRTATRTRAAPRSAAGRSNWATARATTAPFPATSPTTRR